MEKKVVGKITKEIETELGLYVIEVLFYEDGSIEVRD